MKNKLKQSKLYTDYYTNEDGTIIYDKRLNEYKQPYINNSGYPCTCGIPIHRIVASAYDFENYFEKAQVDHLDNNRENNHYKNLEWVTSNTNQKRKYENGCIPTWSREGYKYPEEAKKKQSLKMSGKGNPAAKTRKMIIKKSGKEIICYTRLDIMDAIEKEFGIKYSLSSIKGIVQQKGSKKLGIILEDCL